MLHPFHLIIPKSHTVSLRSSSFYKENRADSQSTKRETKATDYCQLIGNRVQLIKQPIKTESTTDANGIENILFENFVRSVIIHWVQKFVFRSHVSQNLC